MPVESGVRFSKLERKEFRALDYRVMACAFACHGDLGRNCEEDIYRNALKARLEAEGLGPVSAEVPVFVCHQDFKKEYRLDLTVADAAIYELKTAKGISADHQGQLLNYLLLTEVAHGKVLNFRSASLESRFVNNVLLCPDERRRCQVEEKQWRGPEKLKQSLLSIVEDVGLFLEAALYNQVLQHYYGGAESCVQRREMRMNGRPIGSQAFQMCGPEEAFRVTTHATGTHGQDVSLMKLVRLGGLKAMHWINLNQHQIECRTIVA